MSQSHQSNQETFYGGIGPVLLLSSSSSSSTSSSRPEASTTTTDPPSPPLSSSAYSQIVAYVLDDAIGVLEHILSFLSLPDLLNATTVSRRWKKGGRIDPLWQVATRRLWATKKGLTHCIGRDHRGNENNGASDRNGTPDENRSGSTNRPIFWRGQYTTKVVQNMTEDEIRILFQHPLLTQKGSQLEEVLARMTVQTIQNENSDDASSSNNNDNNSDVNSIRSLLELFVLRKMFDVRFPDKKKDGFGDTKNLYGYNGRPPCVSYDRLLWKPFADLSFGSYASSVRDGQRRSITALELCSPFGFEVFRQVELDDAPPGGLYIENDPANEGENIVVHSSDVIVFLSYVGRWYFEYKENDQGLFGNDPKWQLKSGGTSVTVEETDHSRGYIRREWNHYNVQRRKDWGWKLESSKYVLYSLDFDQGEDHSVAKSGNVLPFSTMWRRSFNWTRQSTN
jgi:F-box domain